MAKQNRAAILRGYAKKYRLSKKSAGYLDKFFRGRSIITGMTKEMTVMLIDLYMKTDLVFEEADKRLKQEHDERMAL